MSDFVREWLLWSYLYLQHVFVMMYWVTVPGLLACAFLSVRYRTMFRDQLLKGASSPKAIFYAVGLGMTTPASRREALATFSDLMAQGALTALCYLIASQALGLYFLLAFTILIGLEFSLGLFLGGLAMILITTASAHLLALSPGVEKLPHVTLALSPTIEAPKNWQELLLSRKGWRLALKDIGHIVRALWLPSLGGLFLGGLILALDMRKAWPLPFWLGDEGFGPAIASSFLGPLLSFLSFSSPLGNLIVTSSVWKTWTVAYPGIISFVLAAPLHPLSLRSLMHAFHTAAGKYFITILYVSASIGSLAAAALFRVLGLGVTHVPWFEPLVKKIIMTLPFTMLGGM